MITWLNNRTIQTKLLSTFIIIFIIGILVIAWNTFNIREINANSQEVLRVAQGSGDLAYTESHLLNEELTVRDLLLGLSTSVEEDLLTIQTETTEYLNNARDSAFDDEERVQIEQLLVQKAEYEARSSELLNSEQAIVVPGELQEKLETSTDLIVQAQSQLAALVDGRMAMMLGTIEESNQRVQNALLGSLIGVIFFVIMSAVVTLLARQIVRPITTITTAAAAVEAGTFEPADLDQLATRGDEFGQLARVFQTMAREVYAREERLKQQLQVLKIEIDQGKKERQVSDITESEFFQDLQARARSMRRKSSKNPDPQE